MKIGIIGPGVVGKAVGKYYEKRNYPVFYFDREDKIKKCDKYFICVPTPYEDRFIFEYIDNALSRIGQYDGAEIIIKSTVPPNIEKIFNLHNFRCEPEFLSESTAEEDFEKMTPINISNKEAAMVKMATNFFYGSKVIFFNLIYNVCEKEKIDYENVRKHLINNPSIGNSHSEIWHKGYRGYGGKCLNKDIKIFIEYLDSIGIKSELPKLIDKLNKDLNGKNP